jgi:peptide/nickel transport system permease protein
MLMPTFILGIHSAGLLARYVRSSLLDNMRQDYVRTARSKGLNEREVITRHAIKPSLLPIVTVVGLSWGHMLAGAFFVEVIFALPGLGRMGLEAVFAKDFPVIQALLVVVSLNVLVMNFLVDAAYALLDPRVRLVA